jgi:hypothetical protein
VHRCGAATQSLEVKVLEREAVEIREPLQCVTRNEELSVQVSRRLLQA